MKKYLLVNTLLVNEGLIRPMDVLLAGGRIEKISPHISDSYARVIDLQGNYLIPGMIDDQVHFRDPGLTYKADLHTESMAAVAGGVTSFMDMPNTIPNTMTRELLEEKYQAAARNSLANFSIFMGLSSSNWEEALRVNNETVCGITDDGLYFNDGEILANKPESLDKIFARAETLVALHSEDEGIIRHNYQHWHALTQGKISMNLHSKIRSKEACVEATKRVLEIQARHQNRLHFFHISTGEEANLFPINADPIKKRVSAEACVHHLWFEESDYERLGGLIKWNPSIKTEEDRRLLLQALAEGRIDIIASDHAPHTMEEKVGSYEQIKSGAPIVQHTLAILFQLAHRGEISVEKIIEKTSHRVADIYRLKNRGYIREGYYADLVEVTNLPWQVTKESLHYKCAWSPLVGETFQSKIKRTFVNGTLLFENDQFVSNAKGSRLFFEKIR